jgi:hypothetical protein
MQPGFRKVGTLIVTLLLLAAVAFSQGIVTGSISGTVVDQQQAVIVGAQVTAVQQGTNTEFKGTTNSTGNYRISGLPIGAYIVTISAPNYSKLKVNNVVVTSGHDTAEGLQALKTGGGDTVVDVEATAPLVESQSSQIGATFEGRKVAEMAGIGNNLDLIAQYTPGVVSSGDNNFSNTNGASVSVNGQRGRSNNFQIDGQSNNDNSVAGPSIFLGNQDVIAEYQIVTNNFSAEYGRNMGSVVNYVTKSGTNKFHGTGFEFYTGNWSFSHENQDRSTIFGFCAPGQAVGDNNTFTNSPCTAANPIPRYVENRFGGTVGGPIWHDKSWFFVSGQGDRIRSAGSTSSSGTSLTPTPAGITALAAAFPGNASINALQTIGPYSFTEGNPTAGAAITTFAVSNGTTIVQVPFASVSRRINQPTNDQQWTGRYDWQISNKDRFFARYIYQKTDNINATAGSFARGDIVDVNSMDQQIGFDYTRTFSSNVVNQARFSFSRASVPFEGGTTARFNCSQAQLFNCPSGISFSGGSNQSLGLANNLPQGRLINVTQYQDNLTWTKGRHTFKFGGEYGRQRSPNVFLPNANGTFTFTGTTSSAAAKCARFGAIGTVNPVTAAVTPSSTACGFSNFLANTPTSLSLTDGPPALGFKEQDVAFYAQDDWKIKDNLTLNIGMRWEWDQQAINLLHKLSVDRQTGSTPFWNTTLPLDRTTIPAVPEDFNNFGPNIGFAWTPKIWEKVFGQDKTVFRGGFRVAYDPEFYNMFLNVATAAPVVNAGTITTGNATAGFAAGIPTATPTGNSLRAAGYLALIPTGSDPGTRNQTQVASDFHNPYAEQWSFGMQRSITSKVVLESRYVGNHTVGNFQTIDANPNINFLQTNFPALVPSGVTKCTTAGSPGLNRVDCNRTNVRLRANTAFSIYHGWQNELRVQSWHGLTGSFAYTYSKTIDNASEIFSTFSGGTSIAGAMNPFDVSRAERGVSGISYPNVFTGYWIYDLPFFKSQQGILGHLLGGWQWNGGFRWRSGQPFTDVQFGGQNSSCDPSFATAFYSSVDTCRPILSGAGAPLDTVGQYCTGSANQCAIPGAAPGTLVAAPANTLVSYYDPCLFTGTNPATGGCAVTPVTPDSQHWIYNDNQAALFLKNPFLGVGRNTLKGQRFTRTDSGVFKNTNITERVKLQMQFNVVNVFNQMYRGTPDPFIDDVNFANGGSFNNNFFNSTSSGRYAFVGAKIIF